MMKKIIKKTKKNTWRTAVRSKGHRSAYRYPIARSEEERERFRTAISDWNGRARASLEEGNTQIGVLGEKCLHSILKFFLSPDASVCEVPIRAKEDNESRGYIADICVGNKIYEIQTGSFYPLIPKISYYLEKTDYDVTVVHPIPATRYKIWVNPETGEAESRKRSPKKGCAEDSLKELFWLREMIGSPRFHVMLLFLEEDEYRYLDGWSADKKRGSSRCERVPSDYIGRVDLYSREDYAGFLMQELPSEFVASEFGVLFGLRGKTVYSALKVFLSVGLFEEIGTRGRSILYRRTDLAGAASEKKTALLLAEESDLNE